jgi:hypothetical protein
MDIWAKIGIVGVSAALWIIGGQTRGKIRDIPIPILLGLGIALFSQLSPFWRVIAGVMTIATGQSIRIGYGALDAINDDRPSYLALVTQDSSGEWVRLLWGAIVSVSISAPLVAFSIISVSLAAVYIVSNCIVNFLVSKLKMGVLITDVLVSAAVMSIIFYL